MNKTREVRMNSGRRMKMADVGLGIVDLGLKIGGLPAVRREPRPKWILPSYFFLLTSYFFLARREPRPTCILGIQRSTFNVRRSPPKALSRTVHSQTNPDTRPMPKILIIEDTENNRVLLTRRLKPRGHEIITVEDANPASCSSNQRSRTLS